ncbi:MAG: copper resistance protein NlpE [Gammaproteobacteria bacterium]|jgi:uncharacterized lipoprotein NlpE involved in copper resistance|nr:copper resistance protein NlpE [Gammaproteobacteria bacterium]
MARIRATLIVPLAAALVACTAGDGAPGAARDPGAGGDALEWQGRMPCADCEAIDTRLVLEQRGSERLYELVEVYLSVDGDVSFEESGEWRLDHAMLSLEPEGGGIRRYALVHGGALQARDLRGRTLPGRERGLLQPVQPDH